MPASSAASTTRFGRGLVDPAAEVVAPEADHRGVELADAACFHAASVPRRATSGRARLVGRCRGRSTGAGGRPGRDRRRRRCAPTVSHAITPPSTASTAQIRSATATRPVSTPGGSVVSRCTSDGSTATASRPASRAAALFTPDATPELGVVDRASTVDGERRDRARQTEAEHDHRREHGRRRSCAPGAMRVNSSSPTAITIGPIVIGSRGADALRERARPRREQEHQQRHRHQRRARLERRVAQRELELEHDHEQRAAERAVHRERRAVGAAELPVAEQPQRQHRVRAAVLDDEERDDRADADERRTRARAAPKPWPLSISAQHNDGQPDRGEHRARPVERLIRCRRATRARGAP